MCNVYNIANIPFGELVGAVVIGSFDKLVGDGVLVSLNIIDVIIPPYVAIFKSKKWRRAI